MIDVYYDMIFKRKSFHMFREVTPLSSEELEEIQKEIEKVVPLHKDIKTHIKLVHKDKTSCKRGEYCILIYSEQKDGFLQNAGYIGEQLDLYLASKDIGVCWYGLAKPHEMKHEELDFLIMLAIGKTNPKHFRKDYRKCARRPLEDISNLECDKEILEVVRYAPSACNSQPWFIEMKDNTLNLYRTRGKKSIVPADKMSVINRVDIGIITLFLDVYFTKHNIAFSKEIHEDYVYEGEVALDKEERILNAVYRFN